MRGVNGRLRKTLRALLVALIFLLLLIDVYPVFFMILSSFKTASEISMRPIYSLPQNLQFVNYVHAVKYSRIGVLFGNTVIVTGTSVVLALIMSAMASFGVTKMKWRGQKFTSQFLTMGMFIPVVRAAAARSF